MTEVGGGGGGGCRRAEKVEVRLGKNGETDNEKIGRGVSF